MLGTLFDLGDARERMPRVLHHAAALTLAGGWAPFDEVVRACDRELAQKLQELEPYDDAREALSLPEEAWVLTNGTREATERLLERTMLRGLVAEIHTVEEVRKYKPHPDVYELLPRGATLVAAHAWDVAGARAAGYRGVWVDGEEQEWPLPVGEPGLRASTLVEAAQIGTA
jgi:2-haloacid dehalogenase